MSDTQLRESVELAYMVSELRAENARLTAELDAAKAEVERLREELSEAKDWCPHCGDNLP